MHRIEAFFCLQFFALLFVLVHLHICPAVNIGEALVGIFVIRRVADGD